MTEKQTTQTNCDECLKRIKKTIKTVSITAVSIIVTAVFCFSIYRITTLQKLVEEVAENVHKNSYEIAKLNIAVFNVKE